ncbi:MAG TPA: oligopeptide transporter, OPT family [Pyrinomonadaceae bacterium]|nr:oligopeptide transporter, OPT family [Pyrinomonadaceae bacterium]
MATETVKPVVADPVASTNEYPDIVGAKPDNPWLSRFTSYIPARTVMRELTPRALIVGTLLGMVFGASSLYLVLKVGLTVSASIPVAVISITLFRLLSKMGMKNATILENNIVQTAGSAGESIAFGVGVTMPAIMILGFDLEMTRVLLVSVLGGLLGILMMIPLRRALIVQQHGILKYPEGTACAEVLKVGASDESKAAASDEAKAEMAAAGGSNIGAKTIFAGFGIGFLYQVANKALYGWKEIPEKVFGRPFEAGSVGAEVNPALLGVGYIIGPRIASIMCAGGVLAYLVLIPAIKFFGAGMTEALPPGDVPISQMGPHEIRGAYVLYIGAGAVAAGGIISLFRSLPTIWHGLKGGIRDLRGGQAASASAPRTDQDLSMKYVLIGIIGLMAAIILFPQLGLHFTTPVVAVLGALMIIAFGFLFVTVSSRLTGEIGSSSNPISGMTVATLLLTCLIFLVIGWTGPAYFVTALSIGAIVCIAASNGGTTSQDLKTGFLVGATPKYQQVAILIGAGASAVILGPILLSLNSAATVYAPVKEFPAEYRVAPEQLGAPEQIQGPEAATDSGTYRPWHNTDASIAPAGKYLVDDQGVPKYRVDPGINGTEKVRPDGTPVSKFDAPKATLMSYIIKGVLDRKLPWGLVLLGVMISIVLEMSGIPSLAFAVGVYLPLASSAPIFVGGMIRWLVDRSLRKRLAHRNLSEEQLVAEGDKSPGVLMASGYIAGGAIAGIVIAFMAGVLTEKTRNIEAWAHEHNPFFNGPSSDLLSLVPFALLALLLYAVGREWVLASRPAVVDAPPPPPRSFRE